MSVRSLAAFFEYCDADSEKRGEYWKITYKCFLGNDGAYPDLEKV